MLALLVGVLGNAKSVQVCVHQPRQVLSIDATDSSIELHVFLECDILELSVKLGTIAQGFERVLLAHANILARHSHRSGSWHKLSSHNFHCGGLSGTIVSQQSEYLAGI
jgi:hypothetical protein